jgi:hypothetical protein
MARSFQGLANLNPTDKMATLWNAVSGQTSQSLPMVPGATRALRKSLPSNLAHSSALPIQKFAAALSEETPDELVNELLEAIMQTEHAEFMADGMIFYRLDGLNAMCEGEGEAECLKSLQSLRLGVGNYGEQGLSLQFNHLRQGFLTLKMEPSSVIYSLSLTNLNALLEADSGFGFLGAFEGSLSLSETSSDFTLSLAEELIVKSKDEETGETTVLSVNPHSFFMTMKHDLAKNSLFLSVQLGHWHLKSGKSKLEIPGLGFNVTADENSWKTALIVPQGAMVMTVPSEANPDSTSTWSLSFDNDLRASIEAGAATTGSMSWDAVNVRLKRDAVNLASLAINPAVKAQLGVEGVKVLEGEAVLDMNGEKRQLLQASTCYRPVLSGTDEKNIDDFENSSEDFLKPVPCRA